MARVFVKGIILDIDCALLLLAPRDGRPGGLLCVGEPSGPFIAEKVYHKNGVRSSRSKDFQCIRVSIGVVAELNRRRFVERVNIEGGSSMEHLKISTRGEYRFNQQPERRFSA